MEELSAEDARRLFAYDPETGLLSRKITTNARAKAGDVAGSVGAIGYLTVRVNYKLYLVHRVIWLIVTGVWPPDQVDHINGVRSDNRWANLRAAQPFQNHGNVGKNANNTSGFKGVGWNKGKSKWDAYITIGCRKKNLGRFDTPEDAHAAYRDAAAAHFGEFARFD